MRKLKRQFRMLVVAVVVAFAMGTIPVHAEDSSSGCSPIYWSEAATVGTALISEGTALALYLGFLLLLIAAANSTGDRVDVSSGTFGCPM